MKSELWQTCCWRDSAHLELRDLVLAEPQLLELREVADILDALAMHASANEAAPERHH